MELNTSQPHHSEIMTKPSRNPILLIIVGIIVIVIVALGLLVWQKNQEISSVLDQLADTEEQLVARANNDKTSDIEPQPAMYTLSEDSQKDAAKLGASDYYCLVADFGCDKVVANVTKFQKVTNQAEGFAIVSAVSGTDKKLNLWLKYRPGGNTWVVIYEGEAMPSSAITKQFNIPTDFLAVN
jgi:hypothetical protein